MKSILILAAALGLSVGAAGACSFHDDVQAKVDTTTVASIDKDAAGSVAAPSAAGDEKNVPMSVRPEAEKAD